MGGLGVLFSIGLAIADRFLAVRVDPRVEQVLAALPGANCGACGEPGCQRLAERIVAGEVPCSACPAGGPEAAAEIAAILGIEHEEEEGRVVRLLCRGGLAEAIPAAAYVGIRDCRAAQMIAGGGKGCAYGCLGQGTCEAVCPFGAITMDANNLPVVDDEKCTGCGVCVAACPRCVLRLYPRSQVSEALVTCRSQDRGKAVTAVCSVGCIACRQCIKVCPVDAITMEGNVAVVDPALCIRCGACIEKCPRNTIVGVVDESAAAAAAAGAGASEPAASSAEA